VPVVVSRPPLVTHARPEVASDASDTSSEDTTRSDASGIAPPTAASKVMSPAVPAVSVRPNPPFTVESNSIPFPAGDPLVVFTATASVSVTAELKFTASPVVVTSPAVEIPVAPVSSTVPPALMSPADAIVSAPVSAVSVTAPLPDVAVIPAFTVTASFEIDTPVEVDVVTAPPSVVVPVPVVCTRLDAVTVEVNVTD